MLSSKGLNEQVSIKIPIFQMYFLPRVLIRSLQFVPLSGCKAEGGGFLTAHSYCLLLVGPFVRGKRAICAFQTPLPPPRHSVGSCLLFLTY